MVAPFAAQRASSKRIVGIAVLVAFLLLIPTGSASASGPSGTIQGYIRDATSLAPIANAMVRITATDVNWVFQSMTDGTGYYAVSVPNHLYTVAISSPRYYRNATTVSVGSGFALWNNMTLSLAAPRTLLLEGYVTDSVTSAPVTTGRVVVTAAPWLWPNGYANWSALNASGFYSMNLVPATYSLATEGVQNYTSYAYAYLYSYGPGVQWFNFTLTPNPLVAWINGTVENASTYTTISGANVTANVGGLMLPSTLTNATGAFSLHVPTGTIDLTVDALGYAPGAATSYVYSSGTYTTTVYLTPLSGGTHGYVRNGLTGRPLPGILVNATPLFSGGYYDEGRSDGSGYYAINLPADDYVLTAGTIGYTSWYSYAFLSSSPTWLNITLWPIVATVQGYLVDGGTGLHVAGRTVSAYDPRSGYSASSVADGTGFYSFVLPPSPATYLRVYGSPPYAGAIAYLNPRPYAVTWLNLTLARLGAVVHANVTDGQSGLPISGATVSLSWSFGANWGLTDATGAVTVPVPQGLGLTVYASALGYFGAILTLPPVSGTAYIDIVLNPALTANVTVEGYVRGAVSNTSLVFAYVEASGYNGSASASYTDGLGYYSLQIVPARQTVRVTAYGYAAGSVSVNPAPGSTIWANFSLATDTVAPLIVNFTATPAANIGPGNPTTLRASVNETSFDHADLALLMLQASAAGVGTFLDLGRLDPSTVNATRTAPGNVSVVSSWNTRTPVARLSDAATAEWWPAAPSGYPFLTVVTGYWNNATLGSPTYGTAYFDSRTGALLYVWTTYGYIAPQDQPTSTFTPYAVGLQVNLATATILGSILVTGSTFSLGTLAMSLAPAVPGGQYAALLEAWDAGGNYARAAVLLQVVADTVPPVANAGPDQTVNQGATVTLNGTASTDNTGIVNCTWTFTDGSVRHLYGAIATHVFPNAGSYVVTLTVRDASGNTGTDALTVTVRDTTPPVVSILAPLAGASITGTVTLSASATDNVGVVRVEFLVDGVPLGNATTAPYTLTLDTRGLTNGNHTLEAMAFDAAGNTALATRHVTVSNTASSTGPLGLDLMVWMGLLAVLAAVVLGVVFIILRRKNRREQVPVPPPPPPPPPPP